jgi:hypothetical protein
MNADVSRRAARAFQAQLIRDMDPLLKGALARRIEAVNTWEDLTVDDRALLRRAEAQLPREWMSEAI